MAKIENCLPYVIRNEGGYSNHPSDPGGATNWGITIGTLSMWKKHKATVNDVKSLTLEEATQIYKAFYWDACKLDDILDSAVATCIFDVAVNRGVGVAKKYMIEIAAHFGHHVTGINLINPRHFIKEFEHRVEQGYQSIAASKPKMRVFLKGWLARARRMLGLIKN